MLPFVPKIVKISTSAYKTGKIPISGLKTSKFLPLASKINKIASADCKTSKILPSSFTIVEISSLALKIKVMMHMASKNTKKILY